jgi:hypothetical protein
LASKGDEEGKWRAMGGREAESSEEARLRCSEREQTARPISKEKRRKNKEERRVKTCERKKEVMMRGWVK